MELAVEPPNLHWNKLYFHLKYGADLERKANLLNV